MRHEVQPLKLYDDEERNDSAVLFRSGQYAASRPSVFAALKGYCLRSKAVHSLSAFYSRLLETRVTPLQTLHLLHAQLAFVLMVFPLPFSPFVRFLFLGWFALTVAQCRRAGLK